MKMAASEVEHVKFFDKMLELFAGGKEPKRFTFYEGQDSFIWPYSFPFLVGLTKWLNKKKLYRFTMKKKGPLLWLAKFLGFLFGSIAIYVEGWTAPVIDNIQFVYGKKLDRYDEKTRRKIYRDIMYRNCKYLARLMIEDLIIFPSYVFFKHLKDRKGKNVDRYRKKYEQFFEIRGKEILDDALETHGGAILLFFHVNSFTIGVSCIGLAGYECLCPVDAIGMKAIARFMKGSGLEVVDAHDPDIKGKIDKFVKGASKPVIALAPDVGYPHQTLMPFFTELCRCPVGPVILSQRYNYPILPMWDETDPKKFYHVINIGEKIELIKDKTMSKRELVNRNMIKCNKVMERIILKNVATWAIIAQAHNIKRFNPYFEVSGLNVKEKLIKQLVFFKKVLLESYEENRNDEAIAAALDRAIGKLRITKE